MGQSVNKCVLFFILFFPFPMFLPFCFVFCLSLFSSSFPFFPFSVLYHSFSILTVFSFHLCFPFPVHSFPVFPCPFLSIYPLFPFLSIYCIFYFLFTCSCYNSVSFFFFPLSFLSFNFFSFFIS